MAEYALPMEWADAYFQNRLHAGKWADASEVDRAKSLAMAGGMIQSSFRFGSGTFHTTVDGGGAEYQDCVDAVKRAICEQALYLLAIDPTEPNPILGMGISSGSAGGASATFSKEFTMPLICEAAKLAIGEYGEMIDTTGTGRGRSGPLVF